MTTESAPASVMRRMFSATRAADVSDTCAATWSESPAASLDRADQLRSLPVGHEASLAAGSAHEQARYAQLDVLLHQVGGCRDCPTSRLSGKAWGWPTRSVSFDCYY